MPGKESEIKGIALLLLSLPLLLSSCSSPSPEVKREEVLVRVGGGDFDPSRIYARSAEAVVTVLPAQGGQSAGQGSGFLLPGGLVATNAHVVLEESGLYPEVYLQWLSGNRTEAEVLLVDRDTDLAILRTPLPSAVTPLRLSRRKEILPGEPVAAIGSPFGESQSLSTGIVSAVGRSVRSLSRFQIIDAIQTDASINPGNSGGPLLDGSGQVIGVSQQIQTASGGNDGVGYAVPASELQRLIGLLREGEELRYAYIGLATQEVWPQLAQKLRIPPRSLLITDVVQGGPGSKAGLREGRRKAFFQGSEIVLGGDVLLEIDDKETATSEDLARILQSKNPGDRVRVVFWRNGKKRSAEVLLGKR